MESLDEINLIDGMELARRLGFSGVTSRFRQWLKEVGIKSLPGRKNVYDPRQVRACLDGLSGLDASPDVISAPVSLTAKRRARRNAK